MRTKYLTAERILFLHSIIIDETGGLHGVRDRHLIASVAMGPRQTFSGKELYPTVFSKAALYAHNIIGFHPFVDGNKRTGMLATGVFLEDNGYVFTAERGEIEHYALRIARGEVDIDEVARWLRSHVRSAKRT